MLIELYFDNGTIQIPVDVYPFFTSVLNDFVVFSTAAVSRPSKRQGTNLWWLFATASLLQCGITLIVHKIICKIVTRFNLTIWYLRYHFYQEILPNRPQDCMWNHDQVNNDFGSNIGCFKQNSSKSIYYQGFVHFCRTIITWQ